MKRPVELADIPDGFLQRLRRDQRGIAAIITALLLPVLAGALAMVVDIGFWRYRALIVQKSADAAALAVQYNINSGIASLATQRSMITTATSEAQKNGWSSSNGGSVTVNNPPKSGPNTGNASYVEVLLVENDPRLFSAIWGSGSEVLNGRAVATLVANASPPASGCILALDPSASSAINIENQSVVYNQFCELYADSNSASAISVSAQSNVWGIAATVGAVSVQSSTASWVGKIMNGQPFVADPYASVYKVTQSSKPSTCSDPNGNQPENWNSGTLNLNPGRYCQGFSLNGGTLNLAPGIYYFDSYVNIQNGVTVNGTGGVTIIFSPNAFGQSNWNSGTVFNLVAPSSGPTAGFVFAQFADDSSSSTQYINNNVHFNFTGAIYLKTKQLYIQSGGIVGSVNGASGCGQIVADTVVVTSNMTLGTQCNGVGVVGFGNGAAAPAVPPSGTAGSDGTTTQAGAGPSSGTTTSSNGSKIVE